MIRSLDGMMAELRIQKDELPKQCAIVLSTGIVKNIVTQGLPFSAVPYGEKYKKWKQVAVGHLDFWRLYGDMIGNIMAFPEGDGGWTAGIVPGSRNREGKGIAWYAGINEAKRPLFGPSREQFKNEMWDQLGKQALNKVVKRWKQKR